MKGEVVAFIGAPGVGSSFLTKQMACRHCSPGFFEGEDGIFTPSILSVINSEEDTSERYDWLTKRIKTMLERAHAIAKLGITSYVDGDVLLVEAWQKAETGEKSRPVLQQWLKENASLMADKVVVLTAYEKMIEENIINRGRKSEQADFIKQRALCIGKECAELEKKYKHVKVLDRSGLDFTSAKTLEMVENLIQEITNYNLG
jgi:hypothetical protein